MPIEPLRHLNVFSPQQFGEKRVDVIGAGATGSAIALELAKLGVKNLHVWDFDIVEDHNLANQCYGLSDVGKPKVEALAELIRNQAGMDIVVHNKKCTGEDNLGQVVFLLTDTMISRKEIAEGILFNPMISLLIETRMGAETAMIYSINPSKPSHVDRWKSTLYDDEETEESTCGARTTVGATAKLVTSFAIWQFLKWNRGDDDLANYHLVSMTPPLMQSKVFE